VDFWDVTNREDWAACESVQRGVSSPHYRPGPLASNEDAVYQWVTLVARAYLDPDAALRRAVTAAPGSSDAGGLTAAPGSSDAKGLTAAPGS